MGKPQKKPKKPIIYNDDAEHYRIKSVDPKHNVFNRKLMRKAKRQGVKDIDKYVSDHTRKKKVDPKVKSKLKEKIQEKQDKKDLETENMHAYYNKEADDEYAKTMLGEDDRFIKFYEKKLGLKKNKETMGTRMFNKDMERDGIDNDLFDFLDNISKKVKTDKVDVPEIYKKPELAVKETVTKPVNKPKISAVQDDEEDIDEEGFDGEDFGEFDEEEMEGMEGMEEFDDEDEFGENEGDEEGEFEEEKENKVNKNEMPDSRLYAQVPRDEKQKVDRTALVNQHLTPEKKLELERTLRGCINRVAESNIDSIYTKMIEIYNANSKYVINELYSEIFMKSFIDQPHVLQMILSTNACLVAGLYQLLGDDFIADFIRKLTEGLRASIDDAENNGATGNFKLRNIILMFCFLYNFDVLHDEFLGELVVYLADHLNEETINNIMLMIQNSGYKIRLSNPGSIKLIIDYTRQKYEEYKKSHADEVSLSKKMDMMFLNLNDLKHNKKIANDTQDRMTLLNTWIKKTLHQRHGANSARFPPKFEEILKNNFDQARWWMPVMLLELQNNAQDFRKDLIRGTVRNENLDKLEKLAIEQRFTSDIRKRLFMTMMSADDYLDASQKILKIKLNKKQQQEIAVVIVESCTQEEKFNKFYAFLADNLIRVRHGLKISFQYVLWDYLKQVENFTLRKIANLAKMFCFLVSRNTLGLQILRTLEFDGLSKHQEIFLSVFFKEFYTSLDNTKFKELIRILNENETFAMFREGLKDYLRNNLLKSLKGNQDPDKESIMEKVKVSLSVIKSF